MTTPAPRRRLAPLIAAVALLVAACAADDPRVLTGYQLDPPPSVAGLTLPDEAVGDDVAFTPPSGSLMVVYFGYTSCPDVCPTTLATLKKALKNLGRLADRVEMAMVTIDPARDSSATLAGYVHSFVPEGHALRTSDDAELRAVTNAFGASYTVAMDAGGKVEVSHSGAMYVVDPAGDIVLVWPFGVAADGITTDLKILFDEGVA